MRRIITILSTAMFSIFAGTALQAQSQQTNTTHGGCLQYKSNGYAFDGYPAALNTTLSFISISTITGNIYGQNWKSGLPETRALNTATDWHNGGYGGGQFGATGGWMSAFFYSGPAAIANGKDLIDIRFGSQDGLSPSKTSAPTGTQHLYIVQRNRDMAKKNDGMTLAGFDLKICGILPGPQDQ